MDKKGELCDYIQKGIDIFYEIYEYEMELTEYHK